MAHNSAQDDAKRAPKVGDDALYLRHFPRSLRLALKGEAARMDTTLRGYVVWLLTRRNYTLRALGEHRLLEAKDGAEGEKD